MRFMKKSQKDKIVTFKLINPKDLKNMSPKDQHITNWKDLLTMNTIKNNKILIKTVLIE
jgi:hypothetical protein